jgi:glycosyltransferase involved in cell wall biosynthesis
LARVSQSATTVTPRRFAFVSPRYGDGILGGAEAHCRAVAEKLAERGHDVRIVTTTALSYRSWRSELPAGSDRVGGLPVERHVPRAPRLWPLDEVLKGATSHMRRGERGLARVKRLDAAPALGNRARDLLDDAWSIAQGPWCPTMPAALARASDDLFVFFGYLYFPTLIGVRRVAERAAIAPLADENAMFYTRTVQRALRSPRALLCNVDEEAERIRSLVEPAVPPMAVVALGLDSPPAASSWPRPTALPHGAPYLLVLGRAAKARPMVDVWRAITALRDRPIELDDGRTVDVSALQLVTAGEISPQLEGLPRVVQLGHVDDATRWGLAREALMMVSPSDAESLSLVLLEGWQVGRPGAVNAACAATLGHVRRCGGGVALDFSRPDEAARRLVGALARKAERDAMAAAGSAYTSRRYGWSAVIEAYEAVADAVAERRDVGAALRAWGGRTAAWTAP